MKQQTPTISLEQTAKDKAANVPDAELQREILAQQYIQTHFQTKTHQLLKSQLGFYTTVLWLYIVASLLVAGYLFSTIKM